FFSSRRRHTRSKRDWSSDVCSSDLLEGALDPPPSGSGAPRIQAPVLIVAGRHDPTTAMDEVEALHRSIPGSELVILEESGAFPRSEEHTSELQSRFDLVCRLLLEKK